MAKRGQKSENDESDYDSYAQTQCTVMDTCARTVIRGVANYGAGYLLNPNIKFSSGTYPYDQYVHDGHMLVESGFLKYKIVMRINGSYEIDFGKTVTVKGAFSITDAEFAVNALAIKGHVKFVKNDLVSEFDYVWEGKSFLKKYRYTNSDIIKIPRTPQAAAPPHSDSLSHSDSSYR